MKTRSKTRGSQGRELTGPPVNQSHQIQHKKTKKKNEREAALPMIEEVTTINDLPLDCLSHIFSYLSVKDLVRLPAVCKYWRDLKSNAWRDVRRLDLISFEKSKNPSSIILKRIQMNSKESTRLRFTTGYPRLLSLSGRFLKVLEIPVSNKFDILGVATDYCQNLRRICVCFDSFLDKTKQCQDLGRLFEKNKETLRSVIIVNMGKEFNEYVECLLQLPEELVELQLWDVENRYRNYTELDIVEFFHHFVPAILRFKNLQVLGFDGICLPPVPFPLEIIESLDDLRYLQLSQCIGCGPLNVKSITSCRKLQYLSLKHVFGMDSSWFTDLVKNNPTLKHIKLQVHSLKPEYIVQLFPLSNLTTLSLTGETRPWIAPSHLDLIDMSGFHALKRFICTTAGDRAIIQLMETASELEFVNLCKSRVSSLVLDRAHEVTSRRINNVSLHVVVDDSVLDSWEKPENTSPLLAVESSSDYNKRIRY